MMLMRRTGVVDWEADIEWMMLTGKRMRRGGAYDVDGEERSGG